MNVLGHSKITSKNQLYVPKKVINKIDAEPGESFILFKENSNDEIILKKGKIVDAE